MRARMWHRLFVLPLLFVALSCGDASREALGPSDTGQDAAYLLNLLGGPTRQSYTLIQQPPGAVGGPTLFTMLALPTGYVEVDVTALVPQLLGSSLNIGAIGFRKPVRLSLSYARATNVRDPQDLFILRMKLNGRHEVLPSTVDTVRKLVTAELEHLSKYCMASN
jgi:hypothetical protein